MRLVCPERLFLFFLIIKLLDPVLVAYLKQVGIGLQRRTGGWAMLLVTPPLPTVSEEPAPWVDTGVRGKDLEVTSEIERQLCYLL